MSPTPPPAGTLYVVATPIGNLEDITLRALRVLKEVSLIAAEDTRRTGRLLAHYGISTATLSLHEHNERARSAAVIARLAAGASVALVTDAGTPLLSDPGRHLIREASAAGLRIEAIPGPSALTASLAASGAIEGEFAFYGFPPNKTGQRRAFFERARTRGLPFVMFEAPHRLVPCLQDARAALGDVPVVVCRELTKRHEEVRRETLDATLHHFQEEAEPIGEFTLIFPEPDAAAEPASPPATLSDTETWQEICRMTESGLSRRQAVTDLARRSGRSARDVYASAERGKALTS